MFPLRLDIRAISQISYWTVGEVEMGDQGKLLGILDGDDGSLFKKNLWTLNSFRLSNSKRFSLMWRLIGRFGVILKMDHSLWHLFINFNLDVVLS